MNTAATLLNVIDVESTCWPGGPPPGQVSEIIEIGLTTVDLSASQRIGRHRVLVRPQRSDVSPFCTELTGLTQADVEGGLSFTAACRLLAAEHHARSRPWVSWGDYDRRQFIRQCEATSTEYPFGADHINAKTVFAQAHGLAKPPGMAAALRIAGLPLDGRHHCGADDAWNIAALILRLHAAGQWPGPQDVAAGAPHRPADPGPLGTVRAG
ncbi:MAG TPA: 3'-5' exonuclease [Streptosporangiaceae bacterium]|nr:3'-5' exonuclease [Streptosporangiaceae bacterium]